MHKLICCILFMFVTAGCASVPALTLTNTPAPTLTSTNTSAPVPTLTNTTAPAMTPTITPDLCAGATSAGARQRFTFEQIVPCLNSVSRVSEFMKNNIIYDVEYDTRERGGNEYVPAQVVYERGIDDADGHAILQCYLLERNGWDAVMIGLSIDTPVGSNVCGIKNPDGSILILEGAGNVAGHFNSLTDVAKYYTSLHWMQAGGTLRTLKASQVTQVTTDRTSPSILELPWVIYK
ncbi:MAG: hypothetical protein ABSF99_06175 [Anaerolineales bacterium]